MEQDTEQDIELKGWQEAAKGGYAVTIAFNSIAQRTANIGEIEIHLKVSQTTNDMFSLSSTSQFYPWLNLRISYFPGKLAWAENELLHLWTMKIREDNFQAGIPIPVNHIPVEGNETQSEALESEEVDIFYFHFPK